MKGKKKKGVAMKRKKPKIPAAPSDAIGEILGKPFFEPSEAWRRFLGSTAEQIMNPKQAAEHLQVSLRTLYKLLRTKEIPARKVGGQWRIARSRLDEYIREGEK